MNKVKNVNEGIWVVKENIALNSLTIAPGASVAAPEGKAVTMTADGIGTALKPVYTGDIFLTVTDSFFAPPGGLMMMSRKPQELRIGILIDNGKYIREKSVPAIVQGGRVTDKKTTGISIQGCEDNFNGIYVTGDSEYTIENVNIDFEGNGGNDFIGYGAAIGCTGNAKVKINNSEIKLKSVTRCTLHASGHSVVTLNNCRLINENPRD